MSEGALSTTQQAYNAIRRLQEDAMRPYPGDDESAQAQITYCRGLGAALEILLEIDPDADPGEHVPGRVY